MLKFLYKKQRGKEDTTAEFVAIKERADLMDAVCGIGLWHGTTKDGNQQAADNAIVWSPEVRRLIGFGSEAEFPNRLESFSARIHPEDIEKVFGDFAEHLKHPTGDGRFCTTYRLKVKDGSYRWFRNTGGSRRLTDGRTLMICGSLADVNDEIVAAQNAERVALEDRQTIETLARALAALANGDLSFRITGDLPEKAQGLKHDFNAMAARAEPDLIESFWLCKSVLV